MTVYKTHADDAAALATHWYHMAGVANPTPKAIAWWTKQIQQDGSHTAFLNFADGKGQDAADKFDPAVLVKATAQQKASQGFMPWQPNAQTPQYPGTNTKSGGAIIGSALDSPVGKIIEDVGAGALDLLTGGAATPFTTAGLAALQGGGKALQPGENFGSIAGQALGGAGAGLAAGAASGLLGGALGIGGGASGAAGAAGSAIPDAASMSPGSLASVADASGGASAAAMDPATLAAAANASGGGSAGGVMSGLFGSGNGIGGSGLSVTDLLKGVGSGIGAYTNQANEAATLAERKREFDAQNALNTQNVATNEGQTAVQAQSRLNTAPLADQSQYMLKHLMSTPPAAFQPRDYTQAGGSNNTLAPATGGAAGQLAANQAAASNYTPGAGGVDTSTLKLLLDKLKGSGSAFGNMPTTSSTATG